MASKPLGVRGQRSQGGTRFLYQQFRTSHTFVNTQDARKCHFAAVRVLADPFADRRGVPADIQQIVGDLKCQTRPAGHILATPRCGLAGLRH